MLDLESIQFNGIKRLRTPSGKISKLIIAENNISTNKLNVNTNFGFSKNLTNK